MCKDWSKYCMEYFHLFWQSYRSKGSTLKMASNYSPVLCFKWSLGPPFLQRSGLQSLPFSLSLFFFPSAFNVAAELNFP